jgi:2,4-dienoyl-CoA reductase-like NADH-dependent reductase (Old Yellow Enzyme family)
VPYETPRVLTEEDIAEIIEDYARAAIGARAASFDGVESHGANGYLIDQFLRTGTNQRDDRFGGAIENRARFLLEVTDAVAEAVGADRVGVRLSPFGKFNDMYDSEGFTVWNYVADALGRRSIAYLHLIGPRADEQSDNNAIDPNAPHAAAGLKRIFGGPIISAGGYVADTARGPPSPTARPTRSRSAAFSLPTPTCLSDRDVASSSIVTTGPLSMAAARRATPITPRWRPPRFDKRRRISAMTTPRRGSGA